jgi:catechol 2,3-dioxygenase-like lactoylglutathione lyase family enzyme
MAEQQPTIGGIYEVCIGVPEPSAAIRYWQQFGYRVERSGALAADAAQRLYGVNSALASLRLAHQQADHGLIRLLTWERPTGAGLGLQRMRALGSRWGAMLTADLYEVVNHIEVAAEAGHPLVYYEPHRNVIYQTAADSQPFIDRLPCVRELALIQPTSRQVLFQRYGYTMPYYGQINASAQFKTSQITHVGLVAQGGPDLVDFYEQSLGLLRARDGLTSSYEDVGSRLIFDLQPGESYICTDFDDPRSDPSDLQRTRSGRLKIIRFPPAAVLEDCRAAARPGCLGLSLYTYRVREIAAYHRRVTNSPASDVMAVTANEFGEPSFSFVAPDGYAWTLVEDAR